MTLTIAHILGGIALAFVLAAELWHARRVRRVARLSFGTDRPPAWVWIASLLRIVGIPLALWGAAALLSLEPRRIDVDAGPADAENPHRLVILFDVSPSMYLTDAGPTGNQSRRQRAGDVVLELLKRVSLERVPASVIAFYSDARPVVTETTDEAVLRNIFNDLPLDQAFEPGPSELFKGLEHCFEMAKRWPPESASLIVVSDGDVTPSTGMPYRPRAFGEVLVVGVGDPRQGSFIAGRQSKQDAVALAQTARRLGGRYVDANVAPLPTWAGAGLSAAGPAEETAPAGLRELALAAIGVGAIFSAAAPILLAALGAVSGKLARSRSSTGAFGGRM